VADRAHHGVVDGEPAALDCPNVGEETVGVHGEIRPPPGRNRRSERVPIDLDPSVVVPTEGAGRVGLDVHGGLSSTLRLGRPAAGGPGKVLVGHRPHTRYLPAGGKRVLWTSHALRWCSENSLPGAWPARAAQPDRAPTPGSARRGAGDVDLGPPPPGRWLHGTPGMPVYSGGGADC